MVARIPGFTNEGEIAVRSVEVGPGSVDLSEVERVLRSGTEAERHALLARLQRVQAALLEEKAESQRTDGTDRRSKPVRRSPDAQVLWRTLQRNALRRRALEKRKRQRAAI